MAKELRRKCSHCGHNGHNSRTCNGKGCIKLFGVKINVSDDDIKREDEFIRKCKSMGNLQACNAENNNAVDAGYLSDGLIQSRRAKAAHERRKGRPWTEHEHRSFLIGLEKLGKGDWRGISKTFVPTRTPTQVASHAQKYFLRLTATEKRKRRSSVFDIGLKESHPRTSRSQASPASPPIEAPDSPKQASTCVAASMKTSGEIKTQAGTAVPVTTFERPPLSPIGIAHGAFDFRRMPYMQMGASSSGHGQPKAAAAAASVMPAEPAASFAQVMNFANRHNYVYLPSFQGRYAACAAPLMPQQFPARVPPLAAPRSTPLANKDGVDLSLGALTL